MHKKNQISNIFEVMRQIEERQVKLMTNLSLVTRPIWQLQKKIQRISNLYQESIIKPIQEVSRAWEMLLEPLKRVREWVKWIEKIKEKRRKVFLETGWWLPPSLRDIPLSELYKVSESYLQGDKNAIDKFFIEAYRKDGFHLLRVTSRKWTKKTLFKPWIRKIELALDSHYEGKYALSIPVFLIAAEGIAGEYIRKNRNYQKLYEKKRHKKGKSVQEALGAYKEKISGLKYGFDLDILLYLLENKIYKDPGKNKRKSHNFDTFLNRHIIFHGLQPNYDSEENSLKAILLLDMLSLLE